MKKQFFLLASATIVLALASCGDKNKGDVVPPPPAANSKVDTLFGDISANKTLSATKNYFLKGNVFVTKGATLTIEPGTIIRGDKATKGALIITKGSKINAVGTAQKPIVFTSNQPANARDKGDWGGVILLGQAPINNPGGSTQIEGIEARADGLNTYGGTKVDDNSGIMQYVRIEFAGVALTPNNEINGLTFGGVGNGTTIDHIMVYRSGDDSYEWFGGTVNCSYLIAAEGWDDDFDTDNGFSGNVQFCVGRRSKENADVSGSNGFESDNDKEGSTNTPKTMARFANMTIIGPIQGTSTSGVAANFQHMAQIRKNSSMSLYNSVLMGYPIGLYIDDAGGAPTSANATAGTLQFKNNIIAGCPTPLKSMAGFDITTWFNNNGNTILTSTLDVKLTDPYKFSPSISNQSGTPNFLLAAGSPALTGASFSGLTGFQTVAYRGAFDGTTDWTAGWANWNPETTNYEK